MLEKLQTLRARHLKAYHDTVFYPYQERISDAILSALLQNLRLTSSATEKDIKKLKLVEVPIEISRQAGKTTAVVLTVEFVMIYLTRLFNRRLHIGIFAPQREQAKTDFDRLKEALKRSDALFVESAEAKTYQEQSNAQTLVLPNGSSCYIFPVTSTSKPESKSLDLMIFEESQDLDDRIVKEQIWPMGASTNAPRVFIGTAGTRKCYFLKIGRTHAAIKLYFEEIVAQRRQVYEATGDVRHLVYEQYVRQEIEKHGLDADEIQRPYFGKWLIGTGNFTTEEDLLALMDTDRKQTFHFKKGDCYAGIDTAKNPDSTVVTIVRDTGETRERRRRDGTTEMVRVKELLNWCELRGDNYKDQFDVIKHFLDKYRVVAVAVDSTGQGDFMPDMFARETQWQDEDSGLYRVKFSLVSKDVIYKNLKVTIRELLTRLPNLSTKQGERFKEQMLDLQQEYKGQLLSVHHPNDPDAHDDYCFAAGTLILTSDGQVPIEDVRPGMLVMTRDGFKPVVKAGMTGYSSVITRFGITATSDHPFITARGVKAFIDVDESDAIYEWNEETSSIEEGSIADGNAPSDRSSREVIEEGMAPVYNLQVLDKHEYFANNVLVHNCDSWALAEWAFARWTEESNIDIVVINGEKERTANKNDEGEVTDDWPGEDSDW